MNETATKSRIKLMPHGKYRIVRKLTGKPIRKPWNNFDTASGALIRLSTMDVKDAAF